MFAGILLVGEILKELKCFGKKEGNLFEKMLLCY